MIDMKGLCVCKCYLLPAGAFLWQISSLPLNFYHVLPQIRSQILQPSNLKHGDASCGQFSIILVMHGGKRNWK